MASLVGAFDSWSAWWSYVAVSLTRQEGQARWADQYAMLKAYYLGNGLYEVLDTLLSGLGAKTPELRPLRNPAFRVVEFYAAKIWPGPLPAALPILADNQAIIPAIEQVWTWSNWGSEKQTAARWFATYGDMFLKVATRADELTGRPARVFIQNIEPQYVTDFDADERGYLTYIRIDIPQRRRTGDQVTPYTHTEVWTKANYRLWEHTRPITTPVDQLGPVTAEQPTAAFGIDFVPVVWQPFRNIGDERGTGAFTLAIDKIDEANRQATRLHQMLYRYNKALWVASANAMDAQGRPLPAPKLGGSSTDAVDLDDDTILRLPGLTTLQGLVPPINYSDALAVLNAQLEELQRDLPELAYYELRGADVSGKAAAILLGDAVDRLLEARGNAETALVRADQMALTIGQALNIFTGLGDYAAGDFDHRFAPRPVLELDATLVAAWVQAGMPLITVLREWLGWNEERIAQLLADKDEEANRQQAQLASALVQAQQGFDQNQEGA